MLPLLLVREVKWSFLVGELIWYAKPGLILPIACDVG